MNVIKSTDNIKKLLILDTCIVQATSGKISKKAKSVLALLDEIVNDGYTLAVSEFTVYENLDGLWGVRAGKAVNALEKFEYKTVSNDVLLFASMLGGMYHSERIDNISVGDKIIAATTVLEGARILTENHKDFPNPFFICEKYIPLQFEIAPNVFKTLDLVIYKPNDAFLVNRINSLDSQ